MVNGGRVGGFVVGNVVERTTEVGGTELSTSTARLDGGTDDAKTWELGGMSVELTTGSGTTSDGEVEPTVLVAGSRVWAVDEQATATDPTTNKRTGFN